RCAADCTAYRIFMAGRTLTDQYKVAVAIIGEEQSRLIGLSDSHDRFPTSIIKITVESQAFDITRKQIIDVIFDLLCPPFAFLPLGQFSAFFFLQPRLKGVLSQTVHSFLLHNTIEIHKRQLERLAI